MSGLDINEIIAFEQGDLEEGRLVALFQKLTDSGHVWTMQGVYGRTAIHLIAQGLVSADPNTIPPRAMELIDDINRQRKNNQLTNLMRGR